LNTKYDNIASGENGGWVTHRYKASTSTADPKTF